MIYTRSGKEALAERGPVFSPRTNSQHWGVSYFGPRHSSEPAPGPHAIMSELRAGEVVYPHYHGISMFQVFIAGSGTIGSQGKELQSLMVQFKDHHTAYGPITSGPQGLCFLAMRMVIGDCMPVYLDQPGYREKLKPSKRRNLTTPSLALSTDPVMEHREVASWEPLLKADDGLCARMLRLGAGMKVAGPDPRACGGYYLLVVNGSLQHDGAELPMWSMVVVENNEDGFEVCAGSKGLEVLVLEFPMEHELVAA